MRRAQPEKKPDTVRILGQCCLLALLALGCNQVVTEDNRLVQKEHPVLSPKAERVINEISKTIHALGKDELILTALTKGNSEPSQLNSAQIIKLEQDWSDERTRPELTKELLRRSCSQRLITFQENHREIIEIFLTNRAGINICQSSETSDLFQADEEWWQQSFSSGMGRTFFSSIEFDESAESESISLYIPVGEGEVVGIFKALVSVNLLKEMIRTTGA